MKTIKRLELENVTCFDRKTFDLSKINFLFSSNGTGKTSFMKALNYALTGDYPEGLKKNGAETCSVKAVFEDGFFVERRKTQRSAVSRIGAGPDSKQVTKEAANAQLVRYLGGNENSIRVIASSSALFAMPAEKLGKFIMDNIPGTMDSDIVVSYISGCTPQMEEIVKNALPRGKFGQKEIEDACKTVDMKRLELSREIRQDKAKTAGFNLNTTVRPVDEIRKDLDALSEKCGELKALQKAADDYNRLKAERERIINSLLALKEEYNSIKAEKPDQEIIRRISKEETEARENVINNTRTAEASAIVRKNALEIIASLQKGFCPQVEGVRCPKDWSAKINELEKQVHETEKAIETAKSLIERYNKRLEELAMEKEAYNANAVAYEKKVGTYKRYVSLKENIPTLPSEIPTVPDKDGLELKKSQLEEEYREAAVFYETKKTAEGLPLKEKVFSDYESVVKALSPKGEVMKKSLEYYLSFFSSQLKEKAEKIGYDFSFYFEDGLRIMIGKKGKEKVDIAFSSSGEHACAVFLLIDLLHQITGINILMMDEMESLDAETFTKLVALVKDYGEFDQVFFAGVDHEKIKTAL